METEVDARRDVVVVGGGIAGASLESSLASAGLEVLLLEATTEFTDRVRGDSMHTWGVREAQALGIEPVLMDAGAHIAPRCISTDRDSSWPRSRWTRWCRACPER